MGRNQRQNERRARNEAEWQKSYDERQAEESRKASLSMWERINEADASDDVKEILHMLAVQAKLED